MWIAVFTIFKYGTLGMPCGQVFPNPPSCSLAYWKMRSPTQYCVTCCWSGHAADFFSGGNAGSPLGHRLRHHFCRRKVRAAQPVAEGSVHLRLFSSLRIWCDVPQLRARPAVHRLNLRVSLAMRTFIFISTQRIRNSSDV